MDPALIFLGFLTLGTCDRCGRETFAEDGLCVQCKSDIEEQELIQEFSFGQVYCE
jgi:uncharacterized OB-fold protein